MSEEPARGRAARIVSSVVRILALLMIVLFVFFFIQAVLGTLPFQFVGLLLFGWVGFLGRALPQITFNWEIAFDAAVAMGLAVFGLHRILCWWAKQQGDETAKWRLGWTLKITVMVLLLFATSIAAVGMVHQIAWLCREPNLIVMGGVGRQTRELSYAKQLGTAAKLYAMDHQDRFPQRLDELSPDYIDYRMLFTPGSVGDPPQPFLYFTGYGTGDGPDTIILASPRPMESERGGRRVVIHADISGTIIPEAKYQELIRKQPAPSPVK